MKRLLTCFLIVFSLCYTAQAQTVRRVNNTPGVNAPYTTIQAAHDAATAGDIILVEGSTLPYSSVTITKSLRFTGPGYAHTQPNPVTQANSLEAGGRAGATINFNLQAGSGGTTIEGFVFIRVRNHTGNGVNAVVINGLTVQRNAEIEVDFVIPSGATRSQDINIRQNYQISVGLRGISNYIFANNVSLGGGNNLLTLEASTGVFVNNILAFSQFSFGDPLIKNFAGTVNGVSIPSALTFQNNIIFSVNSSGVIQSTGGSVLLQSFNVCGAGELPSTNGTKTVSIFDVFEVYPYSNNPPANISVDGRLKLKANSPAKEAGFNNTDCGIFGGDTPYVLSGIPAVPVITKFNTTTSGNNSSPLQVTISIQSNQ
jgi:hypothetical protein